MERTIEVQPAAADAFEVEDVVDKAGEAICLVVDSLRRLMGGLRGRRRRKRGRRSLNARDRRSQVVGDRREEDGFQPVGFLSGTRTLLLIEKS